MKKSPFSDLSVSIFGNPDTPELMMDFLNELLPERKIVSIEFLNTEDINGEESDIRVKFDIKCKEQDRGYFIVEMQKCGYSHLTDRQNISNDKLSKYDTMVRDEIQIRAEKKYLFEHAIAEGLKQGREQGLQQGMAADTICEVTGLSQDEVAGL